MHNSAKGGIFLKQLTFSSAIASLSRPALLILLIGLPYIAAHMSAVALLMHEALAAGTSHLAILARYWPQAEMLICSLTILFAGAMIFDLLARQDNRLQ